MGKRPIGTNDEERVTKKVAKHLVNVLQSFKGHYAFITRREGPPEGPWHVVAECLSQSWMDQVWEELKADDTLGERLLAALDSRPFHDVYPQMGDDDRQLAIACWTWFLERSRSTASPPEIATVEMLVPAAWKDVKLRTWYLIKLTSPIEHEDDHRHVDAPRCYFTASLPRPPFEEEPVVRQCVGCVLVAEDRGGAITQSALRNLHHAHPGGSLGGPPRDGAPPPPQDPDPVIHVSRMEDDLAVERPFVPPPVLVKREALIDRLLAPIHAALRELARAARRFLDELAAPFTLGLQLAPAGGAPLFYIGSLAPAGDGAQRPNPMVAGGVPQQAFVGVLDIGQGNANPIYDHNGAIVAYYDLGRPWGHMLSTSPLAGHRAAPINGQTQVIPCLCARPLIILSHWDYDHFKLGLETEASHAMTWLAPEQDYSPKGTLLVNAISHGCGRLMIWPNGGGNDHMRFDWGWVERCTGPADNINGSGLAAFVCVRDDPAVERMQASVAAVHALLAGPHGTGGDATTERYARPVAAALAAGTAVATARVADAAVRATVAALNAPVAATEDALTAFIGRLDGAAAPIVTALGLVNAGLAASLPAVVGTGTLADPMARRTAQAARAVIAAGAGVPADHGARATAAAGCFVAGDAARVQVVSYPAVLGGGAAVPATLSAKAIKARAAADATGAMVAVLVGAPAHTLFHSRVVAAALAGADQSVAHAAPACARAAVRAVVAILGAGGATTDVQIGTFLSRNDAGAAPVTAALTIVNAGLVASLPAHVVLAFPDDVAAAARASAAAGVVLAAAAVAAGPATGVSPGLIRTAIEPAPLLELHAGAAPHAPGERYALLNADANFSFIPSLAGGRLPLVVTMTAMHHGSYLEDDLFLANAFIPWAPSAAAAMPAIAAAAAVGVSTAHAITTTTNNLRIADAGLAVAGLGGAIAHAGASAAAAIYGVRGMVLHHNAQNHIENDNSYESFAQGAAAAVLSSLAAPTEAGVVAVAATLAANQRAGVVSSYDFARIAQLAVTRLRAGDDHDAIRANIAAAFPFVHAGNTADATVALGDMGAAVGHDNIRDVTLDVCVALEIGPDLRNVLAEIASAAWEATQAAAGAGNEVTAVNTAKVIGAGGRVAAVSAVMAMEISTAWPGAVNLGKVARTAAESAILGEAQRLGGRTSIELAAALDVVANNKTAAAAAAAAVGNASGPIAYSYGVNHADVHCYLAPTLGNLGHPHPLAIAQYEARGWTNRRNAASNANHVASQGDVVNPRGHVGLGWSFGGDVPLTRLNAVGTHGHVGAGGSGQLRVPACATCGQIAHFNL